MSLVLENVGVAVPGKILLAGFALQVEPGEIVTVMGPSGRGKTVLLNYLTGHVASGVQAQGEIRLDGRRIEHLPPEQRGLGILFQDDLLFPHMSLGENLMFAVPRSVKGRSARRQRASHALGWAQLDGLFDRHVQTLSGG
ncbi:MAG: ATP-binding cassette domain-containing protein, partial [Pseudomonadota bacterium]